MDLQLNGKTALVTGSTAGIGLEIARRLAVEGADVVICGRTQDKLDAAIRDIGGGKLAGSVRAVLGDPATADGAEAVIRALPEVDILVNNLGIYEAKKFEDISDADWLHIFEVNVLSGVRLARHYFSGMLQRDWGRIIFISSESALLIPSDMIQYGMTKTAQLSIARGLAALTKGTKVTVNSILPGPTQSAGILDFMKSVVSNPGAAVPEIEAEFFANHRPLSLIQRLIDPAEVAGLTAFVASPLSAATNGAALRSDGGIVPTIA